MPLVDVNVKNGTKLLFLGKMLHIIFV